MGKLRGIVLTPELRSVVDAILALPQHSDVSCPANDSSTATGAASSLSKSASAPRSALAVTPVAASLERVRVTKLEQSRQLPSNAIDAKSVVRTAIQYDAVLASSTFMLVGLDPLKFLIDNSKTIPDDRTRLHTEIEAAVRSAGLSFAPNVPTITNRSVEVEKRLERLRMLDEERSYGKLTRNLKTHSSLKDDDITTKSMMYASSVGLNMIVAPISFGVFMYFFAGGVFGRFFDGTDDNIDGRWKGTGGTDIRRVIAGVVSGVFMLFVEMILFVIRSHELDAEVARKGRRRENRSNPFGYTQKSMARVYVKDD